MFTQTLVYDEKRIFSLGRTLNIAQSDTENQSDNMLLVVLLLFGSSACFPDLTTEKQSSLRRQSEQQVFEAGRHKRLAEVEPRPLTDEDYENYSGSYDQESQRYVTDAILLRRIASVGALHISPTRPMKSVRVKSTGGETSADRPRKIFKQEENEDWSDFS